MPELRSQMPAGQRRARLVELQSIRAAERRRDPAGSREVRIEAPGQRTLGRLHQPARVAHERVPDRGAVQSVEQCLDLPQPRGCALLAVIPYPKTEMLKLTK